MRHALACAALGLAALAAGVAIAAEQRLALVIGNAAYPGARLANPGNDARAVGAKLQALGFEVILKTDINQREMTRAISQFGQRMQNGGVALFYYAGHGLQVRGRNFLVPVDAEIVSEASVRSEAVDVDQLLEQLGPARLGIVILDACRNNPYEGKFRTTAGTGLAQIDAPKGTLLAYATAPGKVASDGNGANGLYTAELLKALDVPGLKVEEIFKAVRVNVIKATQALQIPWESSSLTGEFYFRPDAKAADATRQADAHRLELLKAVDDERTRRERDAEALKKEMESLRAELLRLSRASAAQAPATTASQSSPAAPVKRSDPPHPELAVRKSEPVPKSAPKTGGFDSEARFRMLEGMRGQLSFSKAVAVLMDLTSEEELAAVLTAERDIKALPYESAVALGMTPQGTISRGFSWRHRLRSHAADNALELCRKYAAPGTCRVVIVNGELQESAFIEVAKGLADRNPVALRRDLLRQRFERGNN
ncbi:MAG TPA: caspase family protein [Usitatibacter sp.]|nr:caspase family protein [Usitatibacter sp.]